MDFRLLLDTEKPAYADRILALLQNSDREFVPPLSQRNSTTQGALAGGMYSGVDAYFREMMTQRMLICLEDGKLLGFVSFRENYTPEHHPSASLPNIYISTLILAPESRGRGLTKKMYHHLFLELFADRSIYTRTWSTNVAHIRILDYFGFSELLRLPNHRGQGIDTVYFSLLRKK